MRIAFVTQKIVRHDGQGRVNAVVVAELLRRGHRILVIASELAEEFQSHPRLRWIRVTAGGLPTRLVGDQVFAWRAGRALAAERAAIDRVVTNGFVCWARSDVNLVHFVHSAWMRSPAHPIRKGVGPLNLYRALLTLLNVGFERWSFRRAGRLVAVSRTLRDELIGDGIAADRVHVIDNGVDAEEFHPGTADPAAFGFAPGQTVALFVGDARSDRKNLGSLLHALTALPNLALAVVGDAEGGPYPGLAHRLGLDGRVRFLGHRRDVAALMRAADLFVLPTRHEPFGLALLEAAASGLPIVTTRLAGASWLLEDGGAILLDDPERAGDLVAALARLAADPEARQRLGAAARRIAERCGWAVTAKRHAVLIEELGPPDPQAQARGRRATIPAA